MKKNKKRANVFKTDWLFIFGLNVKNLAYKNPLRYRGI